MVSNLDNGVERKTRVKIAHCQLDCEWGFDMAGSPIGFPFYIFSRLSFLHFSTAPISSSSSSWLQENEKPFGGFAFQLVHTSARINFLSLHLEFSQIPASAVFFISKMFLNCSPGGVAKNLRLWARPVTWGNVL